MKIPQLLMKLEQLMKSNQRSDQDNEFLEMLLSLESCDEAIEIFEDMYICPVCLELINNEGVLVHKDPKDIIN